MKGALRENLPDSERQARFEFDPGFCIRHPSPVQPDGLEVELQVPTEAEALDIVP